MSDVMLGLQALDLVKYEEFILTDKRLLYYTNQSIDILLYCEMTASQFPQENSEFTQRSKMRSTLKLALYTL